LSEHDELFGPKRYKRGFKRPRLQCELVSSWNKHHVAQEDYEGEIARIMAKSMHVPGWKSLQDTMPGLFPIIVSKR
jgi:hypothetical protein